MASLTLQQYTTALVTALLEKRYQYALTHRQPDKRVKFPTELSFKHLAKLVGVSSRTLNRWYTGESKTTTKTEVFNKLKRTAQKHIKSSQEKLKRAGKHIAIEAKKIHSHIERLKFKHGRPTWRVHTIGWPHQAVTDFVWSIIREKKGYDFMFTIYANIKSGDSVKPGSFMTTGWNTTMSQWTYEGLHRWILREQLSRGEVYAIIFTSNKGQ